MCLGGECLVDCLVVYVDPNKLFLYTRSQGWGMARNKVAAGLGMVPFDLG
jgi:hypothetical protein